MLSVRNWDKFQHYKARRPPWIKLHRELLEDRSFLSLPLASQALAPRLWLLASETDDGSLSSDPEELAFRMRCSQEEIVSAVKALIDAKFLSGSLDVASNTLATRVQVAVPETEVEADTEESQRSELRLTPPAPTKTATKPGWTAEACDSWAAFLGAPPGGKIGSALKPLVEKHTWDVVRPVWADACAEAAASNPKFQPAWFAEKFVVELARWQARHPKPNGSLGRREQPHEKVLRENGGLREDLRPK